MVGFLGETLQCMPRMIAGVHFHVSLSYHMPYAIRVTGVSSLALLPWSCAHMVLKFGVRACLRARLGFWLAALLNQIYESSGPMSGFSAKRP
jgi:hypothetical protein